MQKLIAKYGLAAHLALLAVAPLFLWPFLGAWEIAVVMLWLSLPAFGWTLLEPSVHGGEGLHNARRRVLKAILVDPLFWASLVLVAATALRAINTGVALAYDAEAATWHVAEAIFPILPGSVGSAGFLPFATAVALAVLLQGCRHSLGRSARTAFLLVSSALSGLSAVVVFVLFLQGRTDLAAVFQQTNAACSFVGFVHGLFLLGGIVAMVGAFERGWRVAMLLLFVSVGGNAAGAFAFSPVYLSAGIAACTLIVFVYSFAFAVRGLHAAVEFKMMVFFGISMVLGGLLVALAMPEAQLNERLADYRGMVFFTDKFWESRAALSGMALKSWITHLWTGTGLESFALDFRFNASEKDWVLSPLGASALSNGWWLMLAERGLVGVCLYVLPFGFLLFTYVRRLCGGISLHELPHPAVLLAPLLLLLLVGDGFFDCSLTRAETVLATGAMLAVSAAAFPKRKRRENG